MKVEEVDNPVLQDRYESYRASLRAEAEGSDDAAMLADGNETFVLHGCAPEAIASICQGGFSKAYWTSATGSWQRFVSHERVICLGCARFTFDSLMLAGFRQGPGFYFALQANKSHGYPKQMMNKLKAGDHQRKMILSRVARGRVYETTKNLDHLKGSAPEGYDSVHGKAGGGSDLADDELVVYEEAAILPYAVVTYGFTKM